MRLRGRALGITLGSLAVIAAALFYVGWQIAERATQQYNTAIYAFDDADEWRYTACSRLVEHGYTLFNQVFSAQPPVLFVTLAAGMRVFGDSIAGARWVEVGFGLLALLCVAWITWLLAGPIAAGVAAIALAVSPGFLVYSRAVEAEGPMMALVALALALALTYRRSHRTALAVLAGLALAAAILTKLFALEALLPGLWVVLAPPGRTQRIRAAGLFVAAALLPVAIEMIVVAPRDQWQQVVAMHNAAAGVALPGSTPPLHVMAAFFSLDFGLSLLALAGLVVLAAVGVWEDFIFLALWLPVTALMLVLFRPLFPHHPIILVPALAVSAGCAATVWFEQLRSHRWLAALPLGGVVLVYVALLPRVAHDDRHALTPGVPPRESRLAAYAARNMSPTAMVAVDDLQVADRAGRLVPPGLCDPSNVRLYAGYLPASELIGQTKRYRPELVMITGVFGEVPGYESWLRQHYVHRGDVEGAVVYKR